MENSGTKKIFDDFTASDDNENLNELINEFWNTKIEYEVPDISFELTEKIKRTALAAAAVALVILASVYIFSFVLHKISERKFEIAVSYFENGNYTQAVQELSSLGENNEYYAKAHIYIRKYKTAEELFNTAVEFYNQNNFDEALSTISTIGIIINSYPQAEALKEEIENAKKQQTYLSEELAEEGIKLVDAGDIEGAYEKFEKSVALASENGNKLNELKKKLAVYAAVKIHNAQELLNSGNVLEASEIVSAVADKVPNYSAITIINNEISQYYTAVEMIKEAEVLFSQNKFTEANQVFETAAEISPIILKTHSEVFEKLKGSSVNRELLTDEQKTFLDNIEISNILYTENSENTGMILLFDIKNISDKSFNFCSYWCQAELNGEIYYPEPATQERYVSALKLNNTTAEIKFEEDNITVSPDETYRLMYNFSGERDFYAGAVFYYVDRTNETAGETEGEVEGVLKIPLLVIQ